jgi:hypothetical protein
MVNIVAVDGNTLTIDPPLNFSFTAEKHPEIRPVDYIEQVGIEDLHIKRINTGAGSIPAKDRFDRGEYISQPGSDTPPFRRHTARRRWNADR